jgi:hypothetical protein
VQHSLIVLLVLVIRIAVFLTRVDRLALLCSGGVVRRGRSVRFTTPDAVAAAVWRASRRIPGGRCFTRALAETILLRLHGWDARIVIGIRSVEGKLYSHAWVCTEMEASATFAGNEYLPVPLE